MNDDAFAITEARLPAGPGDAAVGWVSSAPEVPAYLEDTYWWAYLHPRSVWLFERDWLVNLILWGQMRRLTAAVIAEIPPASGLPVLQIACVYGQFSSALAAHAARGGNVLDIVDVAEIQLRNARHKLSQHRNVRFHHQDASQLALAGEGYGQTVLFFLLHEQPAESRRQTIAEAIRVTRPGGSMIIVDYHRPHWLNPLRYLMRPVLHWLEPFALDLWRQDLEQFLPEGLTPRATSLELYCGGLYQKLVIEL